LRPLCQPNFEMMNSFLEILKYILPSLVVLATTWYLVNAYFTHEEKKREIRSRLESRNASLSVRLQAYERLVLLLERLQLAGLIMRSMDAGMNAAALHGALVQSIRDEFEHNLSQQLYVSSEAWASVKNAKEEILKMINTSFTQVEAESPAAFLAEKILLQDMESANTLAEKASEFLKNEARSNFF
jgi:hypothetical protein